MSACSGENSRDKALGALAYGRCKGFFDVSVNPLEFISSNRDLQIIGYWCLKAGHPEGNLDEGPSGWQE